MNIFNFKKKNKRIRKVVTTIFTNKTFLALKSRTQNLQLFTFMPSLKSTHFEKIVQPWKSKPSNSRLKSRKNVKHIKQEFKKI